ncbi:MAG: hypothetical protein DRQ88_13020 [Epsilonproteobacteria bacterium]|nr:MAG: hypothetical protein DRQ88_13020 [Campylobacterota bacterium]
MYKSIFLTIGILYVLNQGFVEWNENMPEYDVETEELMYVPEVGSYYPVQKEIGFDNVYMNDRHPYWDDDDLTMGH